MADERQSKLHCLPSSFDEFVSTTKLAIWDRAFQVAKLVFRIIKLKCYFLPKVPDKLGYSLNVQFLLFFFSSIFLLYLFNQIIDRFIMIENDEDLCGNWKYQKMMEDKKM